MTTGLLCRSYELTCISPIHTGSGEKLKPFEYLYNSETHEAAFLNPTKWIAFLDQRGLMDRFSNYVVKGASGIDNLRTWLLAQGVTEDELEPLIIRRAHADPLDTDGEKATLNEIICQTTYNESYGLGKDGIRREKAGCYENQGIQTIFDARRVP